MGSSILSVGTFGDPSMLAGALAEVALVRAPLLALPLGAVLLDLPAHLAAVALP